MAKDSLAQGATSAVFSAGQAERNDPIEFHGTVAEEEPCSHGVVSGDFCAVCNAIAREEKAPPARVVDFSKYQPMNGRVLLRKVVETNNRLVIEPDAFARITNKAEVLAVPTYDGTLAVGDIVLYGEYNAEEILVEGENLLLVDVHDIRLKILA